ncbi:hypothetical protein DOY81_000196 [Sarcophaga bullata]|nr:hypothetical protein DOY81_000196 [Sarcophaga bullata]
MFTDAEHPDMDVQSWYPSKHGNGTLMIHEVIVVGKERQKALNGSHKAAEVSIQEQTICCIIRNVSSAESN